MTDISLKHILEAALLAAGRPLSLEEMSNLFPESDVPEAAVLRTALEALANDYAERGLEVAEVASGFRIQVRQTMERWISRLWEDRPPKYSRALLETLALIAYRQPITRGEIEDIRGVTVSTSIMKTLQEREWIRVVAHRDVPGRPAMYGTTREFLDYFNLKSLEDLPSLAELRDIDSINAELDFGPLEGGRRQAVAAFGDNTAIDMPMLPDDTDFLPVDMSLVQLQAPETLH
ncbi:MAG: SMC-Scp complex subunit ScpB [Gammaproteobacteria bacterium]|nr:SMC-Scp complex subunit ScpB [Gammaproteobacteria bacterium]